MSMDLTGITNQNEYYTNHYFSSIFEENAADTISKWRAEAKDNEAVRTPWALLREATKQYYPIHDRFLRSKFDTQTLANIRSLADVYLSALGYPEASPEWIDLDESTKVPVYLELKKPNGAPALWVILAASEDKEAAILDKFCFSAESIGEESLSSVDPSQLSPIPNEDLVTKILFGQAEPPRFVILIGMNQIALIDRNKWNEKRYLQFELEEIFSRHEESTLQAMAVLLHRNSLCPEEGTALLDELDANSQKHAAGVSQDLKYALRESIELLGNEVLYDLSHRQGRDLNADPVDAGELTLECLRYMYRMLFVLFIEARPELGYAPIKAQAYLTGYSLESLRDIADNIRDEVEEVGDGYYLHETLSKLYLLIYNGYPEKEATILQYANAEGLHDMFVIPPLKAHIFDPEYTKTITNAKLRNRVMLRIIDLMSLTRATGKKNDQRGRISYANLGINQLGSVYEALLSYRGFIAEHTLFEVKRAGDSFNELDVGYFVSEEELGQYTEDERVRYEKDDPDGKYKKGQLRKYEKGTFIYRLAGREREKSASYYTPEVLTKCLVKYALKELLEGKTADEILQLTVCEPAMGSAAFLNEAINQLAEAYLDRRQKERSELIPAEKRLQELQKVKMFIADRNVYGIDLNPVAVELAEVSLWLNTIYEGGFVPWFGTQLVNGNSLIGARRQCYSVSALQATSKGLRWYENAPTRVPIGAARITGGKGYRQSAYQIWHFLLGDPGMCSYSDKVIKSLEPDNIKAMAKWNKKFNEPYSDDDIITLMRLSAAVDRLWEAQVELRREVEAKTQDKLSVYGWEDRTEDSHTTIRQKDKILSELYKSEHMRNAGPYARLKFAMDYWCSLWFWPIDKAELLPSRSEFLFDLSLILEGTIESVNVLGNKGQLTGQVSMFPTEMQQMALDIVGTYGLDTVVDIPALRRNNPRLDLAARIAEQNHFMHWELEFADLFAERGGFDLVIGNPPWIKITWNEQNLLSDSHPVFAVKKMNATETARHRLEALMSTVTRTQYLSEYVTMTGEQSFFNAISNYSDLQGQQVNLYKCFLPQAWVFGNADGISAFVHPNGVFDDPNGGILRKRLFGKLKKSFRFLNKELMFADVSTSREFSLNVYGNRKSSSFDVIANLVDTNTIEDCYDPACRYKLFGLKDDNNKWCHTGHPDRVITVGKKELLLFAKLFDESEEWEKARLPVIHAKTLTDILFCFENQTSTLGNIREKLHPTEMWDETGAKNNGTIYKNEHFPDAPVSMIYSGAHIGVANPLFKTSRRNCDSRYDFDPIDLSTVPDVFLQRCKYDVACSSSEYIERMQQTNWGNPYFANYRVASRRMLNLSGERTLMSAIIPPMTGHINTVYGLAFKEKYDCLLVGGLMASLPYDLFIKMLGKADAKFSSLALLPYADNPIWGKLIVNRSKLLNCMTYYYADLWGVSTNTYDSWAKKDSRLRDASYKNLNSTWTKDSPLRSDYERRQAMIEIDVLAALSLGMSLGQLENAFRIQFPILQNIEADTWYDANGRIVFTSSTNLPGVGFSRPEWENGIKGAPAGRKFYRTITDDTMPGGPVDRTIEYVAPFDRCDREKDYETAWKFFEEKYKGQL